MTGLIFTSQTAVSAIYHLAKECKQFLLFYYNSLTFIDNISQWNSLPTFVVGQATSESGKLLYQFV